MTHFKITLKPMGSFYFGGENSFGEAKRNGDASQHYFAKRSAYFAKGEIFPQQTQLLGMIRKEILRKHGYMKLHNKGEWVTHNQEAAKELVGQNWQSDLGKITQLSPLYLERDDELFLPAPYDKDLTLNVKSGKSYINGRIDEKSVYGFKTAEDKDFGAKDLLCYNYVSPNSSVSLDEIFRKTTRTGNQTLHYSEDDDEQLYKMTSYLFEKQDFHFVCYLSSEEKTLLIDSSKKRYESIVELGGERSRFEMIVSEVREADIISMIDTTYASNNKEQTRIVLLSDTKVSNDIFVNVNVALTNKVAFRSISRKDGFSKTDKIVLLQKGSVFYPQDEKATKVITDFIDAETAFRNIGYNQYKIIEKKG